MYLCHGSFSPLCLIFFSNSIPTIKITNAIRAIMIMVVVGKDILYGKNGVVVGLLVAVGVCPFWEGVESGEGEVVEVMFS